LSVTASTREGGKERAGRERERDRGVGWALGRGRGERKGGREGGRERERERERARERERESERESERERERVRERDDAITTLPPNKKENTRPLSFPPSPLPPLTNEKEKNDVLTISLVNLFRLYGLEFRV
jgi:hypothetical protein